jgi:hypothetical protein
MYRYRELLTSFLASAMFTTALLPVPGAFSSLASVVDPAAARRALAMVMAQAPSGVTPVSADTAQAVLVAPTAASIPAPAIRPEKLQLIIDFALGAERTFEVGQVLLDGLRLPSPFMSKNLRIDVGTTRHSLAVGVTPNDRLIFLRRTPEGMYLYATDRSARLLAAGTLVNDVFTPMTLDQARPSFEAELRKWDAEPINSRPPTVAARQSNS